MSFYKDALPVEQVREILAQRLAVLPEEPAVLHDVLGRTASRTVLAPDAVPAFDKSAMDGYAIHSANLGGGMLRVIGECRIGKPSSIRLCPGQAAYVSTGSPVPEGTGAVVPVEKCAVMTGRVETEASVPERHVMRRGEKLRPGEVVIAAGETISLEAVTLLASLRIGHVNVFRRPSIAFFATGDEISDDPHGCQVPDSITPAVRAWTRSMGLDLLYTRQIPDDCSQICAALAECEADLTITSGGASVGSRDYTRRATATIAEIVVPGVQVKPGSPAFVATRGFQTYLGLPGNPAAAARQLDLLGGMVVDFLSGIRPKLGAASR